MRNKSNKLCFMALLLAVVFMSGCGGGSSSDSVADTRPTVTLTNPADLAIGVARNRSFTATFSEAMNAATITTSTVTLTQAGAPVAGAVTYANKIATFNPTVDLGDTLPYVATITTGATDLGGAGLAVDKTWTFTTSALTDSTAPTVLSTNPGAVTGVALGTNVTATFSEEMDSSTITTTTFTLTQAGLPIAGAVTYLGTAATFNPTVDLSNNLPYVATITVGATDLAGLPLAAPYTWTFTTKTAGALGPAAVDLGTAGDFVLLSKSGISTTGVTTINSHIGVSPIAATAITGFGLAMDPSNEYSTSALVIGGGKVYASNYAPPTPAKMTTAISDMETAYTDAAGRTLPTATELGAGDITGMNLAPGLYKWSTGLLISAGGVTLTGAAEDVWIFQIAGTLTVANTAAVTLVGALPENIFWQVAGQTTLGTTSNFKGIILDQTKIVIQSGAIYKGRALAQTAITLDANTVTKP